MQIKKKRKEKVNARKKKKKEIFINKEIKSKGKKKTIKKEI